MKKIIYLFASLFTLFAIDSCKRLEDQDGNLLNDMDANQGGITGPRFLHQEVTASDTLAEYRYTGMKLTKVLQDKAYTNITYNGDQLNKIEFRGKVGGDSIAFDRFFNYDPTAKLSYITEVHTVYPATTPPAPVVPVTWKTLYNVYFSPAKKLDSVVAKTGQEIAGVPFAFSNYRKWNYTYDIRNNVPKVEYRIGPLSGNVQGPVTAFLTTVFADYDEMKNPYSLLPFGYVLSKTFDDSKNAYWFSTNNPKRIISTLDGFPPVVNTVSTLYTYDPQGYALTGFGINYDYRPF